MFFFLFFSSRRRHTRSKRDWSSDVCSSDLARDVAVPGPRGGPAARLRCRCRRRGWFRVASQATPKHEGFLNYRSEERRVGKEGRGWGTMETALQEHDVEGEIHRWRESEAED